jgi:ketosteroid isomerase-like protein
MDERALVTGIRASAVLGLVAALLSAAPTPEARVLEAVETMYRALERDDAELFGRATTPDFYAFDVGARYTGGELFEVIRKAHAAGRTYSWRVTEPRIGIDGDTAWITYVNRGWIEDAKGRRDVAWLESAVLRREAESWRVGFLHSTRMAEEGGT